jgi:UDP-N-acetylglucosamine:LPS N-acetylglucosamine transferase
VFQEEDCSGGVLFDAARELLSDPERLDRMKETQSAMAVPDATERIYAAAMGLLRERR